MFIIKNIEILYLPNSNILALNAVEAAALQRAKDERHRLSDIHKHKVRQGDILERQHGESTNRVGFFFIFCKIYSWEK